MIDLIVDTLFYLSKFCSLEKNLSLFYKFYIFLDMSGDFVWAIKNGDLEQVKDIIENKVTYDEKLMQPLMTHCFVGC